MEKAKRDPRSKLLAAIFTKAAELGIDTGETGDLRRVIVPGICGGKRLSECSGKELFRVVEHLASFGSKSKPARRPAKKYPASLAGLKQEIADLAAERYGADFEGPLKALCRKFGATHYKWLDLAHAKAVKETLIRLQKEGPYRKEAGADGMD